MNSFQRRLLVTLLGVLAVTVVLVAVLTRVLVGFHTEAVAHGARSSPLVLDHLLALVTRSLLLAGAAGSVAAVVAAAVLSRRLARPLEQLAATARELAQGRYHVRAARHGVAEIDELAQAFNEMAAGVAAVEARRKELVANVSHELRTPLSSIAGYLQGMLDGVFAADEQTFTPMLAETQRLVRLVEDLQQLARAEGANPLLRIAPIDLAELIDPLRAVMQPRLDDNGLRLHVDLQPGLPPLAVDADWARTLLLNLLDNAVRHTPSGGTIWVVARHRDVFVELSVTDTGTGIAPEDLPHVFERFYRGDRSRSGGGGSGIGLAVAKHIAERHGGTITARSQPEQGTTMTVSLPLSRARSAPRPATAAPRSAQTASLPTRTQAHTKEQP